MNTTQLSCVVVLIIFIFILGFMWLRESYFSQRFAEQLRAVLADKVKVRMESIRDAIISAFNKHDVRELRIETKTDNNCEFTMCLIGKMPKGRFNTAIDSDFNICTISIIFGNFQMNSVGDLKRMYSLPIVTATYLGMLLTSDHITNLDGIAERLKSTALSGLPLVKEVPK